MPAIAHKSPFHSSRYRYAEPVSKRRTRGAPSISHRPYRVPMPRSFIDLIVSFRAGSLGSSSSTSTDAWEWLASARNWFVVENHTEARFHGPSKVYEAPYSAVVTCALDLMTEYIPPTAKRSATEFSRVLGRRRTSIGNFCCYLEQYMVRNIPYRCVCHCDGAW